MPIITLASTKGGSTKTTSAITLATTIAKFHPDLVICMVDCDPEAYLSRWYNLSVDNETLPANLKLVHETKDQDISDVLLKAEEESDIVIVDPEGKATMLLRDAIQLADMTLIPLQPSPMDALAIPNIVEVIEKSARASRQKLVIEYHALFTRTKPGFARSKEHKDIIEGCLENSVPMLKTELAEREVYKGYASVGGTLYTRVEGAVARLDVAGEQTEVWRQENIRRLAGKSPKMDSEESRDLKEQKKTIRKQISSDKSLILQLEKAIENSEAVANEVMDLLQKAVEKRSAA